MAVTGHLDDKTTRRLVNLPSQKSTHQKVNLLNGQTEKEYKLSVLF